MKNLRLLALLLGITMLLSVGVFAASEEGVVVQHWSVEEASPLSSYQAPNGTTLAFIPEAVIAGDEATVDIYANGVLYEEVAVLNYGELLAKKEASGLNGKKDVVITGIVEYSDLDPAAGTVRLYNSVGPNDNVIFIPDEATAATVHEAVTGLFSLGTSAGVEALYTFDHGFGLYVDGYYAETAEDCAFYAVSEEGLSVLAGPANALNPASGLAKAGIEAPYSLAVTERNKAGEISAVYYTNVTFAADSKSVRLGLEGNAAVTNELIEEYDQYLDYDFNGFTATSDTAQAGTYLYTGAADGMTAAGESVPAFVDGALNTYAPLTIDSLTAKDDGIIAYADGTEYANGRAVAYATNGGILTVKHGFVDGAYSLANCGILGAMESGSIFWGLSQESGYNSAIFATNGGKIVFGDMDGERSYLRAYGHIANGVFAGVKGLTKLTIYNTVAVNVASLSK